MLCFSFGTLALIGWCDGRTRVIRLTIADAGRTGRFWWILHNVECFVADVHYEDISWCRYVEFKTEPLVVSQNHLIMCQVKFYICIGHFPLSLYNIQHSIRLTLRSYYIATTGWLAAATCPFALAHELYNNKPLTFGLANRAGAERAVRLGCYCDAVCGWRLF